MIIVFAHSKGGTGKTSTAYNAALELGADTVIDLDILGGISVMARLRNGKPLPFNIERFEDRAELLAYLKANQDPDKIILIDAGGYDSDLTRAAIAVADLVLCPCNDSQSELIGMHSFNKTLRELSQAVKRHITVHLFICKVNPLKKRFPHLVAEAKTKEHVTLMESVISYRPDHVEPHRNGLGVTEFTRTRHTAAGKEITALCAEIKTLLKKVA